MDTSSIGSGDLSIILFGLVCIAVLTIWPAWRICSKTGNSGVLALGLLVPVVNIIVILYLAFSEWPIERELNRLRGDIS